MSNKERMNEIFKKKLEIKLLEHFSISDPIAKDFAKDHVDIDLYVDDSDDGTSYVTIGMSRKALFSYFMWTEFLIPTSSRLNHELEQIMIEEISNIISWLHDCEINLEQGSIYTPSKKAKTTFGFDYIMLDLMDMGITHYLFSEPLYMLIPVPLYKNEYEYLKKVGYEDFYEEYCNQVSDEMMLNFDLGRSPMDV